MEYVDGQTLREIVKTQGPMSQQRVIEVMADVCAALDFSHKHSIIHRDVKPANIMINRAGAVKVMDFGIARALGEGQNVTQTAAVIGTAQYLSPEQARGEAVDARSDVYAAGCVLFELLTGEPPFTGDTPVAVAYQHVREDPRSPSELNPQVTPQLDAIVLKALSKNPANRYQSSAEMRADLVRVRRGQQPLAPVGDERGRAHGDAEPAHDGADPADQRRRCHPLRPGAPAAGPLRRVRRRRRPGPPPGPPDRDRHRGRGGGRSARADRLSDLRRVADDAAGRGAQRGRAAAGGGPRRAEAVNLLATLQPVISTVDEKGRVVGTDPPRTPRFPNAAPSRCWSAAAGPATVPPLSGLTVDQAKQTLEDSGLVLGDQAEQETQDPTQYGKIISSNPVSGADVPPAAPSRSSSANSRSRRRTARPPRRRRPPAARRNRPRPPSQFRT